MKEFNFKSTLILKQFDFHLKMLILPFPDGKLKISNYNFALSKRGNIRFASDQTNVKNKKQELKVTDNRMKS